jgi:two-component system, cell cycle response regulator
LVLLDLVLPDDDGRSVLMRIRSSPRMAGTPVYVLSGQVGALARTECLALGADGFIEKPFDPQSLTLQLNAALQQAQERRRQAARDALTGLPNRAAFAELFAKFQAQAARSGRPLTLAIIDLDDLKTLNDTHGHLSGDRAIGHFARVVRQTLRGSDVLTRWGGDEFVALLPDTSEAGADDVLGRVRQALRDQPVELPEGRRRTLTFSAGAALAGSLSQDDALAEADRRVYAAKAAGRDRAITTAVPTEALRHTLLLAEDDAVTAAIVQRRVGDSNLNIVHVTNGRSAWELLGERTFSLAILDVQMPEMDGFELLRKIRADPRLTRLPVIMLTALGNEADVIQAFDAGASDYVPKPFSPAELVKRVHRLLKR